MTRQHQPVPFTRALGVLGWNHLDPILLAALSMEAPVLLVGEHGTAKTLLVERIATALDADFRHYNAALLNYDDLVGIPLPDETGTGLRFVGTAGAVWGAEFVFFDEVNRCRPDLQNKMFPLVHERRVAGVDLPELHHRWAAMNPPADPSEAVASDYLGVEPLDLALADRFWFVIRVPTWHQLTRSERTELVAGTQATNATVDIAELMTAVNARAEEVERCWGSTIVDYTVCLVDLLRAADVILSPRRASMLARSVIGTAAAAAVLGHDLDLRSVAELVVLNGLPQWCDSTQPSPATVVAAHIQAWEVTDSAVDPVQRRLFEVTDPVERLRTGLDLSAPEETLGTLVIGAFAAQRAEAERVALAFVLARALAEHELTPAAWGTIGDRAARMLRPGDHQVHLAPGGQLEAWRHASARLAAQQVAGNPADLEVALITACGPAMLEQVDVDELVETFRRWLQEFGVDE